MTDATQSTQESMPAAALDDNRFCTSVRTRSPWHLQQQHAGLPIALVNFVQEVSPPSPRSAARGAPASPLCAVPIAHIEVRVQENLGLFSLFLQVRTG